DGKQHAIREATRSIGNFERKSSVCLEKVEAKIRNLFEGHCHLHEAWPSQLGLLLNHIGDKCLEIYSNFIFRPDQPNPDGGDPIPGENPDNYKTVIEKFDQYFTKRDPQLMLREKFWLQPQREPNQSFDSWVVTVRERAAEYDRSKLKLYDEGAGLSLDKTITILSMKKASTRELQESKTATIERVGLRAPGKTAPQYAQRSETKSQRRQTPDRCGYCGRDHPRGKINCPAANVRCDKCNKVGHFAAVCRSKPNTRVSQVKDTHEGEVLEHNPTFVGRVLAVPQTDNTLPGQDKNVDITSSENQVSEAEALMPEISTDYIRDPGWHVKPLCPLKTALCISPGLQMGLTVPSTKPKQLPKAAPLA
ncbi:predicted protein, partial [Nematostella vectensis]